MIKKCTCKHEARDKIHGPGKRVFNELKYDGIKYTYRCTVCRKEQ